MGFSVGWSEGDGLGSRVGSDVGTILGFSIGSGVGNLVGILLGLRVVPNVGKKLGTTTKSAWIYCIIMKSIAIKQFRSHLPIVTRIRIKNIGT